MSSEGDELAKLMAEFAADAGRSRPMSKDDMTGGPPPHRYQREVARRAWTFIEGHATDKRPMPDWVVAYLKTVAKKISENLGPIGALSREGAHIALGIDRKAWPKHPPAGVYITMQQWIDDSKLKEVTGPKSAAVRYILERMDDDKSIKVDTVIRWYKDGKREYQAEE
jgi:hypothetical protein